MSYTSYMVHDYPDPPEYEEHICAECNGNIIDDYAFEVQGRVICADCFQDFLRENYSLKQLAEELGFCVIHMEDFE